MPGPGGMFLDVFLLQPKCLGRVQHEHFHAHIRRDFGAGKFGDHHHQNDREGNGPNRRLLAEDSRQWVAAQKSVSWISFKSLKLVRLIPPNARMPPASIPVAAPFMVMPATTH